MDKNICDDLLKSAEVKKLLKLKKKNNSSLGRLEERGLLVPVRLTRQIRFWRRSDIEALLRGGNHRPAPSQPSIPV